MKSTAIEFERFLAARFSIDAEECSSLSDWAGTGNTIGALALRLGLLDLDQIDRILDWQDEDKRLFGELAIDLGFMSHGQVDRLVAMQRFHQLLEVGEQLVIRGHIKIDELSAAITDFLRIPRPTPTPEPAAVSAE